MDRSLEDRRRNIIPRWRDFKTTLALGELKSVDDGASSHDLIASADLSDQIADWNANKSLAFATDLVGAGLVLGEKDGIRDAVDFILSDESGSTDLQRRVARSAQGFDFLFDDSRAEELETRSSNQLIDNSAARVRKFRTHLKEAPRNPIKLVELAREYAILGSIHKAVRTMDVAVALAPANRFVLRSAARLFVHALEFDKAHYVLRRAPSLRGDPWLLAAEIAVSSEMDRTSHHIKRGLGYVEDANFSPFEVSELASAIATVEIESNFKAARKLFRKALKQPTENSIAQAEWASREVSSMTIEVEEFDAPRKYEALASSHFKDGEFDKAVDQGENWILDQPFAVNPVLFTGFVSNVTENFELSERLYRFGLRANPENGILRNNLAFALASNNEPYLAEQEVARIDRTSLTIQDRIVIKATEGLIEFRKGDAAEGRSLYREAIELANENDKGGLAIRALVYLAREEINARTPIAKLALENAELEFEKFTSKELEVLLKNLKGVVESGPESFATSLESAKHLARGLAKSSKNSR
jgi:Tfp pilus assembly protein PilF